MNCEKCGNQIKKEEKFCTLCGASIEMSKGKNVCSSCGIENDENSKFCKACGKCLNKSEQNASNLRAMIKEQGFKGIVKDVIQTPKKRMMLQYSILCVLMLIAIIIWCTNTMFIEIEFFGESEKYKFSLMNLFSNEDLIYEIDLDKDAIMLLNVAFVIVNIMLSIIPMVLCLIFTVKIILDRKVLKPKALTGSKIVYILQLAGFISSFFITKYLIKESSSYNEFKVGMTFGGVVLIITLIFVILLSYIISYQNYYSVAKER